MPISRASASNTAPNSILILQTPWRRDGPDLKPRRPVGIGDKVVVVAKLQEEHTEWVTEELFESRLSPFALSPQAPYNTHSILAEKEPLTSSTYPVRSPPNQGSSPPLLNEGSEAMGHLTYQQEGWHVTEGIFTVIFQQTRTPPLNASEVSQVKESNGSIYDELNRALLR
ncbi:hypothetical protein AnigIFM56816_006733 [Aspergillus niger]|nr:hypothetical protein AnigIFM56816_006733 [Aspergillus niger]